MAGRWPTDRTVRQQQLWTEQVWATQSPGVAISPDGGPLAIVHADGGSLTVVDTEALTVVRTVRASHPVGVLEWLGLIPSVAHAKEPERGAIRWAMFGPKGRYLYTWGTDMHVDNDGTLRPEYLGLRVIDVQDGSIQAQASRASRSSGSRQRRMAAACTCPRRTTLGR
jgi:hypothetical protein